jgi:hypothetical protein
VRLVCGSKLSARAGERLQRQRDWTAQQRRWATREMGKMDQNEVFSPLFDFFSFHFLFSFLFVGTIIRGTIKAPNSQLVTPISIKLQRPDGYD